MQRLGYADRERRNSLSYSRWQVRSSEHVGRRSDRQDCKTRAVRLTLLVCTGVIEPVLPRVDGGVMLLLFDAVLLAIASLGAPVALVWLLALDIVAAANGNCPSRRLDSVPPQSSASIASDEEAGCSVCIDRKASGRHQGGSK
jgi:hypothetical protein